MRLIMTAILAGLVLPMSGLPTLAQDGDVAGAMVAEGAPAAIAKCMVDQLGEDAERLFSAGDDELSDEDTAKLVAALEACSDVDQGE